MVFELVYDHDMRKYIAIKILGGSITKLAESIGCTSSAVSLWPDFLSPACSDRVHAAYARKTGRVISPALLDAIDEWDHAGDSLNKILKQDLQSKNQ